MTDPEAINPEIRTKNRRNLVILFTLGIGPLLVAYVVYFFFPGILPSDRSNQGQLIVPPVAAASVGLLNDDRKWVLTIPVGRECDEACQSRFYYARQVDVALGKESERVVRVLVKTSATFDTTRVLADYPAMDVVEVPADLWIKAFKDRIPEPVTGDYIYLMDPNGNIMMVFSLEKAAKPMLKDIKHLLKISNIG